MIQSKNNPLVKHLINLRKNKTYRYKKQSLLISGKKMVFELIKKNLISKIITTEKKYLQKNSILVSYDILKKITNLPSPEPIAAEAIMPKEGVLKDQQYLLMLDSIQDPGNLGTLIRTANGFSFDGIIFTNTVDPYNEKALRAAKGATFSIDLFFKKIPEIENFIKEKKFSAYLADIQGLPIEKLQPRPPLIIILSNESKGISSIKHTKKITIPIKNINSLNVSIAGGILMHHMRRQ